MDFVPSFIEDGRFDETRDATVSIPERVDREEEEMGEQGPDHGVSRLRRAEFTKHTKSAMSPGRSS